MINFPGQFNGFRVTAVGDRIISFRVDESYADNIKDIVSVPIGTEYVVSLVDVTNSTNLITETEPKEIKERFWSKMHALLGNWADVLSIKPEVTKTMLKEWLKEKQLINESTRELDTKGLAIACNYVEQQIKKSQ